MSGDEGVRWRGTDLWDSIVMDYAAYPIRMLMQIVLLF
ncbi:hypothetical protein DVUA0026 (plasmid) [Nitratidesulfovibrio vulgaris str. Hildenborough]|uniref:Uncharacterized protein n=1 Tax=Nitratidesulfovibrio vulgaris (strain ATCC 29579 / DSM 644 / CCUG 34227 / NCIMB 8303 / VKM B-1760 / Hildenborough) TaxID=882 RepID=Q72WR3_NITV2|nr:hypothetical protein DVUA0026 [Nitratidesulfovibrio vulgaris str. Hildenborough]